MVFGGKIYGIVQVPVIKDYDKSFNLTVNHFYNQGFLW
jgi:hypothetical protein